MKLGALIQRFISLRDWAKSISDLYHLFNNPKYLMAQFTLYRKKDSDFSQNSRASNSCSEYTIVSCEL